MDELDLSLLSAEDQAELVARLELAATLEAQRSFSAFFRQAWDVLEPSTPLHWNWHMETVAQYLQALWERRLRGGMPRLIVNIPPGTSKSLLVSVAWPAWIWLQDPGQRILSTSNDGTLVTRDTQKMRFLVLSEWYQERWGERVQVDPSQREKTHFATHKLGFRQGVPIKGSVTGKRGDVMIIDDPHDAKRAFSEADTAAVLEGYDQGLSTRVNNAEHSLRVLVMQRLRTNDLTGHLVAKKQQTWVHLRIPMEYEGPTFDPVQDLGPAYAHLADPRTTKGELLDAVRFPPSAVAQLKEDLGDYGAAGQLQQRPAPMAGGILKRAWWRLWDAKRPLPTIKHCFASWDTAFSERDLKESAYSAYTLWGVWHDEQDHRDKLLLLSAWYERVGFDELKDKALEVQREKLTHVGDAHLIERKASGISLIQTLRRNPRLTIRGYDPKNDGDKVARAYLQQPALKAGLVWIPDKPWARDAADLVAQFPVGGPPCADLTDTVTQALQYLQRGWWIHHPDDDRDPAADAIEDDEGNDGLTSTRIYG